MAVAVLADLWLLPVTVLLSESKKVRGEGKIEQKS